MTTAQDPVESQLSLLRRVSELDVEVAKLKSFEARIPIALEKAQEDCRQAEEVLRAAETVLQNLKKELRDKEGEVQTLKEQIGNRRGKLTDVKTNKEYTALLSEIDLLQAKIGQNEERQLAIMEEVETQNGALKEKKNLVEAEKRNFEEVQKQKELEKIRLGEATAEELAKRDEVAGQLDPKLAQQYDRLISSGKPDAVVAYKSQACQSCYARLTPQEEVLLRRGRDVISCPQCSRFLYWGE